MIESARHNPSTYTFANREAARIRERLVDFDLVIAETEESMALPVAGGELQIAADSIATR